MDKNDLSLKNDASKKRMKDYYKQMKAIDRKLDGFPAKVRKAVPYILGGSAFTAWAVKSVIEYNVARDNCLTNAYLTLKDQAQQEVAYQFHLNALNALQMGTPWMDLGENIDYYYGNNVELVNSWHNLQKNNPDLYNRMMDWYDTAYSSKYDTLTKFANERGFATTEELYDYMYTSVPDLPPELNYGDSVELPVEQISKIIYYEMDLQNFITKELISTFSNELLNQGINVNEMLDTEIQFPRTEQEYSGFYDTLSNVLFKEDFMNHVAPEPMTAEGLERYGVSSKVSANDLLDELSTSPLDTSTIQLQDTLDIGISGALIAVGTAAIASKAQDYFGRNGKGGLALHKLSNKIQTQFANITNYISKDKKVQQEEIIEREKEHTKVTIDLKNGRVR